MNRMWIVLALLVAIAVVSPAGAEVYSWVDADGVRHFSNFPPPDTTPGVAAIEERPYDAAADRERTAADRATMERIYQEQAKAAEKKDSAVGGDASPGRKTETGAGTASEKSVEEDDTPQRKKSLAQKQRSRAAGQGQ